MKKMLNWTIVKSLAVVAIVGFAIYYAYKYFTDSTATGGNPITGNTTGSNSTMSEDDKVVYKQIVDTLGKNVNIFFKNNYTLKYANGVVESRESNAAAGGVLEIIPDLQGVVILTSPLYMYKNDYSSFKTEYSQVKIKISDIKSVSAVPKDMPMAV